MKASLLKTTEKQFQAQVVGLARLCGWRVYHTHDSRRSEPGFPDLVLLKGVRAVVAELKVGRNTTTAEQREWLAAWRAAGVETYEWRPADWPAIERLLTEAG